MDNKGFVHVYTGNGKGKTTAALGLSIRAVCAGKKVFFGQFVKGMKYSEVNCTDFVPNIKFEQFGEDCFIRSDPTKEDLERAEAGLERIRQILEEGNYDILVLDELNIAIFYNLLKVEDVIEVVKNRAPHIEVIITGRYATKELVEFADLVTDMKEVKHYYQIGVLSRTGVDC